MPTNIYILRLEQGRYYVGKSDNPQKRLQEHINGKGAAWTRKYKPIALEKEIPNVSDFDEDKYTKEYMFKYGIDNVRGGSYVEINLDESLVFNLKRELWGAKNKCTNCGRDNHFVKNCYAKTDIDGKTIEYESESEEEDIWVCEKCDKEFSDENTCARHERFCKPMGNKNTCFRCKRSGHYATNCYASTDKYGNELDD
jgi:predicted GIY-YIG superfamily endonuclease